MKTGASGELALFAAWAVALIATLSVLFIGEVLGQTPCVLCWYQRAFMFPLAVILGIAAWRADFGIRIYAISLAAIGAGIALYHLEPDVEPKVVQVSRCTTLGSTSGSYRKRFSPARRTALRAPTKISCSSVCPFHYLPSPPSWPSSSF